MSTSQTYRSPGQSANASLDNLANAAQDKLSSAVDQAQSMAQDQYDKLTASIRRNPLQAAGIAAGIGFVLALLARR
ncbi:MAG TPA: DUF883 C-terminal domain-containing protein [Methyloceanibacter sp.]